MVCMYPDTREIGTEPIQARQTVGISYVGTGQNSIEERQGWVDSFLKYKETRRYGLLTINTEAPLAR